ncbi:MULTISPECIES: Gfo/Idh/MocA family oxidoreductase [unclassified Halomonas]|uniref:Gfo/Idh/MocA family oxidoreductase n=1 Tax=unclassified Halomonas TaxID=2609666 RepID=UPI0005FA51CF|nr:MULTISPECIES: Gfo/Idh/MocA family oxidoreductase [unclassified Halomonas]KJZ08651.1 hypothetical protein TW86_16260 [Halomonas sp. S2151]MCO7214996.1 Gfo/Idh/MocA family oxidoreductase [Halomonas sp. OfavH-34-E]
MRRIGMLGMSPGNGHPFSFSAILNGYHDEAMAEAGWPVIHDYLERRHRSEFGVGDLRVTHAWTQDRDVTERLCRACHIDEAVAEPGDMLGQVDAVIIARDDPASHRELAAPFLEAGLAVFIDKPLTLDLQDLAYFSPYLAAGRLMSCSGMRFASELDALRAAPGALGNWRLVRGAIVKDWERYGVHLLDAILPLTAATPVSVRALGAGHQSFAITMSDGSLLSIDALGEVPPVFRIEVFGDAGETSADIRDNFGMFRRTLWEFWRMLEQGPDRHQCQTTLAVIKTLIAGRLAAERGEEVRLDAL